MADLMHTPLFGLHGELGAKMTAFAGYDMPVQYPMGVLKEHLHCRAAAGLFDVSHMGQVIVSPLKGDAHDAARALETLVPADILGLAEGRQRYGLFTNDTGGILDDLMIANRGDHLFLVVNAACKAQDIAHLTDGLAGSCTVTPIEDRALVALQGPDAEAALCGIAPIAADMAFMDVAVTDSAFGTLWISRSGYTGEDGFEISVPNSHAVEFARALLAHASVVPIGLGARDSLRLEAGLCLYGADLDTATSPIEADLAWSIQKARRTGGARAGGFPGAERILHELSHGTARRRIGLRPEGRAPMRAGTALFADETGGAEIGRVTSGAWGPSVEAPVSMAYVASGHEAPGTTIWGDVRGRRMPAAVTPMPFRPATYKR
ncbi:MAG: glycine cleavage system aminomethyltransferase GcvT [Rhodobacteraceae bacterium]|nr:glycine cleavage system aminomethyltransferase GcvT [Paracoccaceae bacterium]